MFVIFQSFYGGQKAPKQGVGGERQVGAKVAYVLIRDWSMISLGALLVENRGTKPTKFFGGWQIVFEARVTIKAEVN